MGISDRIYAEVDEAFNPVPMFRLTARKQGAAHSL